MKRLFLFFLVLSMFISTITATDYYVSKSGNDSNPGTEAQPWLTIQHAADTLVAGDTVYIKAGTYNEQVWPKNSGAAGSFIYYTNYADDVVIIDGSGLNLDNYEGLFNIDGRNYIKVLGLQVKNAGPNDNNAGILGVSCTHITIRDCYTYNTVSSGIAFFIGSDIVVDNNHVELACNNGEQECITLDEITTFQIKNNIVHDNGEGAIGGEGIDAKNGCSNGKIHHNHVYNLNDRLGIYVDAWDFRTFDIEVYGNRVHDIANADGIALASEAGGLLENIAVYNNVAYNCGLCGITLSRNTNGASVSHPMKNIMVVNNTVYHCGYQNQVDWGGGIAVDNPDIESAVIRNNVLSNNYTFQMEVEPDVTAGNITIDHNLIHNYRGYDDEVKGTDYVEGDPLFVSTTIPDFHLQSGSPAIDTGSAAYAPVTDYDGTARPQGAGYDTGAYEYKPGTILPVISLNPSRLSLSVIEGSTTIVKDTFSISNSGGGTLDWSLACGAAWLSFNANSGTGDATITVSADPTGLSAGTHYGTVTVSSTNASNNPQTLTVALTVNTTVGSTIALSRSIMNLGAVQGASTAVSDTLIISNSGTGALVWSLSDDSPWLSVSPESGIGAGIITVSADPKGLATGNHSSTITVTAINATNTPQTVSVNFSIISPSEDQPPFGVFETPIEGSTVYSNIPVTGWVLDDVGLQNVKIYRNSMDGNTNGDSLIYIGDAVFVEGARPDVQTDFPDYPYNSKAGWGYMMLTNFLPNQGNGTFTIYAIATDTSGQKTTLGAKTIICDNANAVKPFGTIDTPTQGGTISGNEYLNWGWVLTPVPNALLTDGSTIGVYVNGINLGSPKYNIYRSDIATRFPGYVNSNGAVGYFYLDTTKYDNGVHNIAWAARDTGGNIDGIGSRYFSILNTGPDMGPVANDSKSAPTMSSSPVPSTKKTAEYAFQSVSQIQNFSLMPPEPLLLRTGYDPSAKLRKHYPGKKGEMEIVVRELERLEVHLDRPFIEVHSGYLRVGERLMPLPIGSTLDVNRGIFYWQPGPGFVGNYSLVFLVRLDNSRIARLNLDIKIVPRFSNDELLPEPFMNF